MLITTGKIKSAQKIVIYGPEGIGKSTFASQFPTPIFIDTEGSTKHMDVARLPSPTSWAMLLDGVQYIKNNPTVCQTLVVDTADWAEQLCIVTLLAKHKMQGIEAWGYGKGYTYLAEEFGRLINALTDVVDAGIHVVLTAHAKMRKFDVPEESGSYDRWELKLQNKTAPLVKEWADMVLFANYKIHVVNSQDGLGKGKAQGGKRVMYASHHPCWDAKNRHGLPDEMPLEYDQIAHCINTNDQKDATPVVEQQKQKPLIQPLPDVQKNDSLPDYIPRALRDLMEAGNVTEREVLLAVATRGYWPIGTPFTNIDPGFVQGVLIGSWPTVLDEINKNRQEIPVPEADDLPF